MRKLEPRYSSTNTELITPQPLSLLLKVCPLIDELSLYDVVNTPGVATDLSHISSPAVRNPIMRSLRSWEY